MTIVGDGRLRRALVFRLRFLRLLVLQQKTTTHAKRSICFLSAKASDSHVCFAVYKRGTLPLVRSESHSWYCMRVSFASFGVKVVAKVTYNATQYAGSDPAFKAGITYDSTILVTGARRP